MASKITSPGILDKRQSPSLSSTAKLNGSGRRKLLSWVDGFAEHTANLDSPAIFRRWAAIVAITATLEQKVWLKTSSILYPNLYVFLVGHPGTGKTRTIRAARAYLRELPEPHIAPNSMTFASLVDQLLDAKRSIIRHPAPMLEYHSMVIASDELGTFIHKYDKEMVDGLSAFYDPDPYGQTRRGKDINIKIRSPQINLICGSTPSNLLELMPEGAWGQGFTSRVIMVFSDERIVGDDFAKVTKEISPELVHDLKAINMCTGEFSVTEDYRNLVNGWRQAGETFDEAPVPNHPKLVHYNTRRRVHLYKLSMVSAIDRGDVLVLTREDFSRAMNWLAEAELFMPDIFKAGATGGDSAAIDELYHFLIMSDSGKGVNEAKLMRRARELLPMHAALRVVEMMERSGQLKTVAIERSGAKWFKAIPREP